MFGSGQVRFSLCLEKNRLTLGMSGEGQVEFRLYFGKAGLG